MVLHQKATPVASIFKEKQMEHKHNVDHVKHHYGSGHGHKHEQDKVAEHKASHKLHHEHVKAMCGGGMSHKTKVAG